MKRLISAMLIISALSANAAFAYDANWQVDEAGNWSYIMADGTKAANAWVHDTSDSQWYLLDENGIMWTGLFASSGKYYLLDTVRGTGTYGKLLKNGDSYNGVIIQADTSADYEGALSEATLAQLESQGVSKNAAPDVSNTQHVSNGVITSAGSGSTADNTGSSFPVGSENLSSDTSNGAVTYDGRIITNHKADIDDLLDKSVSAVYNGETVYKPKTVSQERWDSVTDYVRFSWQSDPPREVSLDTRVVIGKSNTVALFEYKGEALDESNSIYDSDRDMIYIKPGYFSQEDWDSLNDAEKMLVGVGDLYGTKTSMEVILELRENAKNIKGFS